MFTRACVLPFVGSASACMPTSAAWPWTTTPSTSLSRPPTLQTQRMAPYAALQSTTARQHTRQQTCCGTAWTHHSCSGVQKGGWFARKSHTLLQRQHNSHTHAPTSVRGEVCWLQQAGRQTAAAVPTGQHACKHSACSQLLAVGFRTATAK